MTRKSKLFVVAVGAVVVAATFWFALERGTRQEAATKAPPVAKSPSGAVPSAAPPPAPSSAQPTKSAASAQAASPDLKQAYLKEAQAVRGMSASLSGDEIQSLYARLLTPAHVDAAGRPYEYWLRNEMMNKAETQEKLPARWADVLITIYQDKTQDVVMRDYAVQHITPMYGRATESEKELLRQVLWQASEEIDSSIGGTALLALYQLAQTHVEIEKSKIAAIALKHASNENCGELSQITAVRMCGLMQIAEFTPLGIELSQHAQSVPLRIAAIASLGEVASEDARPSLEKLAESAPEYLRPAAKSALNRINSRLAKSG